VEDYDDFTERIVRYFLSQSNPALPDCPLPEALSDHWLLGDHRYFVAGGVDDQPAGRWLAANMAGGVWHILEAERDATVEMPVEKRLDPSELRRLMGDKDKGIEGLRDMRKRLLSEMTANGR